MCSSFFLQKLMNMLQFLKFFVTLQSMFKVSQKSYLRAKYLKEQEMLDHPWPTDVLYLRKAGQIKNIIL